jgi:hypothetical protein
MSSAVFAVILLLLEPIGAIFDDVCASAHSTAVRFLDHVAYLTITYYSTTTQNSCLKSLTHSVPQNSQFLRGGESFSLGFGYYFGVGHDFL